MGKKKTSSLALGFAAAGLVGIVGGQWYLQGSDVLTDEDGARGTLVNADYVPLSVGRYSPYSCGRGELFATGFTAKNQSGKTFSGAVCKNLLGKQRISFD